MPHHKSYNILTQRFGRAGQREGLLGKAIFIVKSCWRSPYNKLGGFKYTQPQYIGDLHISTLYNNIRGRQNAETANIIGDTLFIVLVSTEQLIDIRSGHKLSPSNFIVRLPKELIVLTLCLKKRLTNM